jgi:glucosamine--fructose-6-phosphate aminotransferase (isomerizing)
LPAVKVLERSPHLFILGKHEMYAMAMEAALKVKESTYLHAEAFASGELKHGVLALIEKGTPVFALIPDSAAAADVTTGAQEVKARGGYLIGVGSPNNKSDVFDHYIPVGGQGLAATIPVSVVFQLIAYYTTVALGRDPDKPRNLAKSVTVK